MRTETRTNSQRSVAPSRSRLIFTLSPLLASLACWLALVLFLPRQAPAAQACLSARFNDWRDLGQCQLPTTPQKGTCPDCPGMPRWWVTEPYINLHIADEPLSYTMSSGQPMTFRWTHSQRSHLPADLADREGNGAYVVPIRMETRWTNCWPGLCPYGTAVMTDATWCHNWFSTIVFWDHTTETNPPRGVTYSPAPPAAPTNAFISFTWSYEALVLLGDGSTMYIPGSAASNPQGSQKVTLQIIGDAPNGGPRVPMLVSDAPAPYPTNDTIWVDNPQYGFRLVYPDGSVDEYGFVKLAPNNLAICVGSDQFPYPCTALKIQNTTRALLTKHLDSQGRATRIGYDPVSNPQSGQPIFLVRYVVDPDGHTNTYSYNSSDLNQLQQVQDPYGRTAKFTYDPAWGTLASITDAADMTNSFQYRTAPVEVWSHDQYGQCTHGYPARKITTAQVPASGWVSAINTPYGTTTFDYFWEQETNATTEYMRRAILVTDPNSGHELFFYRHVCNDTEADSVDSSLVPSVPGWALDNGTGGTHSGLSYHNTYHWGPRQFEAAVSSAAFASHWAPPSGSLTNGLSTLAPADYKKAHLKHWLMDASDTTEQITISDWISSEREPSRDAADQTDEPRTWYAYAGQSSGQFQTGTEPLIGCIARQLPDGSSQYESREYDAYGNLLRQRLSRSLPGGTTGELTNSFGFAWNNTIDLLSVSNSAGQWLGLGYNAYHQVTSATNALNQVSSYTWDNSTHNLTSIALPSGQNATLTYAGLLQSVTLSPQQRTVTIAAYSNGLPAVLQMTGTALPDLWLTNSWDGLNRLTGTAYPDGTTVSNVYDRLDLGAVKDRLNHWTYYGHDPLQHLTSITDARSNTTYLSWCDCGSLTSILDPLKNLTSLAYNNQGLLTNILFADNSTLSYGYDSVARLTNVMDGAGRALTAAYNNQGLLTTISNAFGPVRRTAYDLANRPVQTAEANGVTATNTFDLINRLVLRAWPSGSAGAPAGVEGFLWATNGLRAYTNQDQQVTRFLRDGAGRILAVTNANHEVIQATYNALDEATEFLDNLNHHTGWSYNEYGWLTSKTDAQGNEVLHLLRDPNGQVTNRWTPQFGNTTYLRDPNGNVTSVQYPASSINFTHDANNRLASMTDPLGTSSFTPTPTGLPQNESGPWPNYQLNWTYTNGLRNSMFIMELGDYSISFAQTYQFDAAWRLQSTVSRAGAFAYTYDASRSTLPTLLTLPNGAYITNHYDALARLDSTALANHWGHVLDGYSYIHDPLGLRTNITRSLGLTTNVVTVGYDNIGQLTSWSARELDGTLRLNEQLGLAFDSADNLYSRTNGALVQTFNCDSLNQLTNVSRNSLMTVAGNTPAPMTNITVNGQSAQRYGDLTFARTNMVLLPGLNNLTNIAVNPYGLRATNTAMCNLPSAISLQWDRNGNLTNDGTRSFSYDPENRLLTNWIVGSWKTEFVYDGLGRRRIARDYTWQSGAGNWQLTNETRFVYDGWQILQERDSSNVPQVAYTRGLDLSGTLGGAGGIGGLLARTDANGSLFYHADGAGNITALMDMLQNVPGRYEYGPFGRLVGMWGPMAAANSMRFSSMPVHRQSGMSLYPLRDGYDPTIQRWIQRDPIGETGGLNLYGFVGNNPLSYVDPYGDDFHVTGASGLLTPGPLGYLSGDTPLENLAAGGYNALPEVGNILANAGQGLMNVLSGLDQATESLLTKSTGDPQLAQALNNTLAVTPIGWPEDLAKAGKLGKAIECIKAKFPKARWAPGIQRYREGDMTAIEHVFSRHGPNSDYSNASRFSSGTSVRDVANMVDEAMANGARSGNSVVYDFGRTIGTAQSGQPASRLQIYLNSTGEVRTAYPF